MANKFESFPTPNIEMPDQYKKHVEGEKEMTPEELRDKNIKAEENFQMPPRMAGERQDFTEKDPDQELIDAINEIGNTPAETFNEESAEKNVENVEVSSTENKVLERKENPKETYRLAMQLYTETQRMVNEYGHTKNTSLENKLRESIDETTERIKMIKDKDMSIHLGHLKNWKASLPEKLNESL